MRADVVIVGGGLGGCAAALAAARAGCRVVLTEETDWIGGQLTQQAVPPDEHPWVEAFGVTRSYRRLRDGIRDYYRRHYPLTAEAREVAFLNPGNGVVSRLCHEPRVALAVLEALLAPYVSGGRVRVLLDHRADAADVEGDRVRSVRVTHLSSGRRRVLSAPCFLDATELGDLLPLTRTEYVTGSEAQADTREPRASVAARPTNHQAFTCCFVVEHLDGEEHTIEKPAEYDFWRNYVPALKPAWTGPLLSLEDLRPDHAGRAGRRLRSDRAGTAEHAQPVALPPYRRPRRLPPRDLRRRPGAGQLAAERLLARQSVRGAGRRGGPARPPGQAT